MSIKNYYMLGKRENIANMNIPAFDILYVCNGFSGFKMNGDKNFYLNLFEKLILAGKKIFVISFSDPKQGMYHFDESSQEYPILHLKRPYHLKNPSRFWIENLNSIAYRHQHNVFLEHIERYVALQYWKKEIKHIITRGKPKYVHYLDTYICSPTFTGITKIVTQTKSENKFPFFYKFYLYLIFKNTDVGLFFNKEQIIYLPSNIAIKIQTFIQPWGVNFTELQTNKSDRKKFMKNTGNILLLWTGYLQQIGYLDFIFAKQLAEIAVSHFENVEFIFAFKTEINIELPVAGDRITYIKPGKEFKEIFEAADILYSPMYKRDTVIGPPLTWIEFIATKRTILTTNVKGLQNYFEKDRSILTFNTEKDFMEILNNIINKKLDLTFVGENAFKEFRKYFDMDKIVKTYSAIYK